MGSSGPLKCCSSSGCTTSTITTTTTTTPMPTAAPTPQTTGKCMKKDINPVELDENWKDTCKDDDGD
jgi:hypothetical protein